MATFHRHAEITANDHGPLVNVASWILLCVSVLFTSFRLISNVVLRGTAARDDWIITVATLLAAAQSIASAMMVSNGLGQHQKTLSESTVSQYEKALLASSILYVAALACTRFSLLFFLSRLITRSQRTFRILMQASWAILLSYLVAEILVLSFACDLPNTWDVLHGHCIDLFAFWSFDTAFDVLTSLVIIALPMIIVSPLQMTTGRKVQAIAAFFFQIPPCAFAIVRLLYIQKALRSQDQTWAAVDWQIWTQINLHFSLVAANMPCLKIFLDGFQSVLFRQNMSTSMGETELHSYPRSKGSKSRNQNGFFSGSNRDVYRADDGESSTAIKAISRVEPRAGVSHAAGEFGEGDGYEEPAEGRIYKTTEWTVLETDDNRRQRPARY